MTNISKKKLSKKLQQQLFVQFLKVFTDAEKNYVGDLFEAVFSETEKIMLIKRVAIVLLLAEGYSTYAIAKTLHVSDKTVRTVRDQSEGGRYDVLIRATRKKSFDKKQFWETLELLSRGGLPPMGKDRWKWLDKHFDDTSRRS